jgi:hypothetical protein
LHDTPTQNADQMKEKKIHTLLWVKSWKNTRYKNLVHGMIMEQYTCTTRQHKTQTKDVERKIHTLLWVKSWKSTRYKNLVPGMIMEQYTCTTRQHKTQTKDVERKFHRLLWVKSWKSTRYNNLLSGLIMEQYSVVPKLNTGPSPHTIRFRRRRAANRQMFRVPIPIGLLQAVNMIEINMQILNRIELCRVVLEFLDCGYGKSFRNWFLPCPILRMILSTWQSQQPATNWTGRKASVFMKMTSALLVQVCS